MQGLWYGDRRDRVKWGALIHIAKTRAVPRIVQVAYYRDQADRKLETSTGTVPLPQGVWEHFSDLRHIDRLGQATRTEISVLDGVFDPAHRSAYIAEVLSKLSAVPSPKIVFLDPDTGVEPGKADATHVAVTDLAEVWKVLAEGDVLVVYRQEWLSLGAGRERTRYRRLQGGLARQRGVPAAVQRVRTREWFDENPDGIRTRAGRQL